MFGKKNKDEGDKKEEKKEDEGNEDAKPETKNNNFKETLFKIMTVMVYLGGVGGTGCMASLYFIIFWVPEPLEQPGQYIRAERLVDKPYYQPYQSYQSPPNPSEHVHDTNNNDNTEHIANKIITAIRENYSKYNGDEADVVSDSISSVQDRSPSVEIYQEDPNSNSNSIQDTRYSMAGSYSQNYLINYDTLESGYRSSSSSSVIEKRSSNSQKLTNDETSKSKIIESSEDMSTNKRNPLKTESQQRKKHETDQLESIETKSASKPVMA